MQGVSGAVTAPIEGYKQGKLGMGVAKGVGGLFYYPLKGYMQAPMHVSGGLQRLQKMCVTPAHARFETPGRLT